MEKELLKQKQELAKLMAICKTNEELEILLEQMRRLKGIFDQHGIEFMKDKHNRGIRNKVDCY